MRYSDRSVGIDCLRAVAVLWVLAYHFVSFPLLRATGTYGVLLFFIISGYCIAFSINASASAWEFYARRLARLLPALIACAAITTGCKQLFADLVPPGREASWMDALCTVISLPTKYLLGHPDAWPDGAYWSLAVEFQFYLLCCAIMAFGGRKVLLYAVCAWCAGRFALSSPAKAYSNDFFPFFIAGLSIAAYRSGERRAALVGLVIAAVLDLLHLELGYRQPSVEITPGRSMMLLIGTALVFAAASLPAPRWLRPVAWIGVVSYPMYLLHQDLGLMFLDWAGVPYSDELGPRLFRALLVPALVIAAGAAIFYAVERPLVKRLEGLLTGRLFRARGAASTSSIPTSVFEAGERPSLLRRSVWRSRQDSNLQPAE